MKPSIREVREMSDAELTDVLWYDWFCKDKSLVNKTKRLMQIVRQIADDGIIDVDKSYVFFKNCCGNKLYDQIKVCDIETRDVKMVIDIDNGYDDARYVVYAHPVWSEPVKKFNSSRQLVRWLNGKEM